ncbi:Fic family protein [Actinoplanes sp. NPDC026623]|uniref:Fic family protein n=1 Tax=Actinoplanes sp. NPDC026623 TaxID=3155610 RepID=UPI0033D51C33
MTIDPLDPRLQPWTLTWAEVDPAAQPFDPSTAPAVVHAVAPAEMPAPSGPATPVDHTSGDPYNAWLAAVTVGLVEHYGRWAAGWEGLSTGHSHGGGQGLRWCCAQDSFTTPERTLDAVAGALLDWRSYLEELADLFARHLPLPENPRAAFAAWEAAVGDLVATAMARTGSEEYWYGNSGRVLGWFLFAAGVPDHLAGAMIDDAIGGRFRSWTAPTGAEVADAAEALAAAVTGIEPRHLAWPDTWPRDWPSRRSSELPAASRARQPDYSPRFDALSTWRRVRRAARWADVAEHVRGPARTGRDGNAEFFATRQEDADRLLAALRVARVDADRGGPLTFARLQTWQRILLGVSEVPFRTTSAWAKGGREWYAYQPDLPEAFDACLAEATDPELPLPSRAARVYLDVAFFHPFPDGNARSAALTLYFVLAREDVVLDQAASLLMTVRPAGETRAAEAMARHVAALTEQTRRRAELTW